MSVLRINVENDAVWHETLRALHSASPTAAPAVTYRCRGCGALLARAGETAHGPLFWASWRMPVDSGIVVNHQRATMSQYQRRAGGVVEWESGRLEVEETHDTIALLRLAPGMPSEYPDLLVRCNKDGDAVLERSAVLGHIERPPRSGRVKVDVKPPHREYTDPRDDLWPPGIPETTVRWSERRRWRPSPPTHQ